ncbi:NADP-dependent oxidoreductase domain-containing protein [Hyaloscypha finlandica]|nr:NADP-dependent oxidoreductase domain-containing protein [Hyaloscypha finlandica]
MAINSKTTAILSSGFEMPAIGFGTSNTMKLALQIGYCHMDCAPVYQNEVAVGRGIKASGILRKELFITSKLWNAGHDLNDVGPTLEQTLKDLGTDYVDLYLIHWPESYEKQTPYTLFPGVGSGKPPVINVPIASTCAKIPPAVNQIPATPYRPKKGRLDCDPVAQKIAQRNNITPAQLVLSRAIQRGTSVIPKSSTLDFLEPPFVQ